MGDTVNVASRFKGASPLGSIYVGTETHRYTQEAFEYRTLEALRLKGKAEPVAVHEVLSVKARLHRARPGEGDRTIGSGMVGRDAELDRLLSHLARLTEGVGSIVSLIGEAGLGKSRLLAEVLARSELQGVTVLIGRSKSSARPSGQRSATTRARFFPS
jgi:hypothetical protein